MPSGLEVMALHGFLGRPSDWDLLPWQLVAAEVHRVDLWPAALSAQSFEDWPKPARGRTVLLGYSLGGRLAMHALLKEPERYLGAVLISAHPGLVLAEEKVKRKVSDDLWAAKFRSEPWRELQSNWNSQSVFQRRASHVHAALERCEADFQREALARALEVWSLSRQRDLRRELAELRKPLLYVTGEDDSKFTGLIHGLEKGPDHRHVVIKNAGHRVPWDNPDAFVQLLTSWLQNI